MATIVSNKTQEIQARFVQAGFTPEEIQAVRDAWNHGLWGDAEVRFADKDEYGIGACTNDIHLAGNFKGREVTNICRKIANRIRKQGLDWINHFNDWWGDGSGDMLFIAEKVGSWDELTEWARTTPEEIQAAMATVESEACKAEESQREHSERIKVVEDRRNNYVAEFQKCQDRKRIASLKRKIARAEARLEVLRSIDSLFQKPEEK